MKKAPDHTSFHNWEKTLTMRKLRRSAEQAGVSGPGAIDASGFQQDQASHYYRDRAGYSFQALKTTVLVDTESLAIMDLHLTTRKSWDGHIGL